MQFLFILAEQNACCPIWVHASHHRHTFFDSVQPLLALSEQRAWCTFFSLLLSASLLRCGLMVSSPGPSASSGGRLPEAFFLVFRLESQGAKELRRKWQRTNRKRRRNQEENSEPQVASSQLLLSSRAPAQNR